MQLKHLKPMAKKAAKKTAKKRKTDGGKGPPNALGLKGKGVEVLQFEDLNDALRDYRKKTKKRCEASQAEIPAKDAALVLFHKYQEQLRQPDGSVVYNFEGELVTLVASKEKVKFSKLKLDDPEDDEADQQD